MVSRRLSSDPFMRSRWSNTSRKYSRLFSQTAGTRPLNSLCTASIRGATAWRTMPMSLLSSYSRRMLACDVPGSKIWSSTASSSVSSRSMIGK